MTDEEKQCRSYALTGGQCELEAGHQGKHFRHFHDRPNGYTWTDEGTTKLADKYGSRFD